MPIVNQIRIACEKCEHSVECSVMNPDLCGGSFATAVSTNFDMYKEYPDLDPRNSKLV